MVVRTLIEHKEQQTLSSVACRSSMSRGRKIEEDPCPVRTVFQVDRDRILHCKAFRRLKYKTQVFLSPEGDHYRTRLTHTLEVSQVARTISRALGLNEDLTEAIALGHDLGHTPFGHAGERVLNRLVPGGFKHVGQSVRVVEILEKEGRGLNLTREVIDGIARHSKGSGPLQAPEAADRPATREGEAVRLADIIAYVNHDLDDALRGGLVRSSDIPPELTAVLGRRNSERIGVLVGDVIDTSLNAGGKIVTLSPDFAEAVLALRDWLDEHVYRAPGVDREFDKAARIIEELFGYFLAHPDQFEVFGHSRRPDEPLETAAADFIAGMTDRFALNLYRKLFFPVPWKPF
nr:deoxyguanosinetriphosphate triphosphohydrolase [Geothermobacter hydrogeniphilus]